MRSQTLGLLVVLVGCAGDDPDKSTPTADTAALVADTGADAITDTGAGTTDTGAPTDTGVEPLQIIGSWTDPFGGTHTIDASSWTQDYGYGDPLVFHITDYDNAGTWLVAQNDVANSYNPELWSRFDWAWDGAALYYCQTAFAAASEAEALATPAPDATDPGASGCGGFPWTALSP